MLMMLEQGYDEWQAIAALRLMESHGLIRVGASQEIVITRYGEAQLAATRNR